MGLIYQVGLSEVLSPDVVYRELEVHVNGVATIYKVGVDDKTFVLPPMNEGVVVSVLVRDVDDAGNVGDWSEPYNFDTKDTIRPKTPGAVTVALLEEVADVVEPVVEVPATEEVVEVPVEAPVEDAVIEPVGVEEATKPDSEDTVDLPPDHEVKFL